MDATTTEEKLVENQELVACSNFPIAGKKTRITDQHSSTNESANLRSTGSSVQKRRNTSRNADSTIASTKIWKHWDMGINRGKPCPKSGKQKLGDRTLPCSFDLPAFSLPSLRLRVPLRLVNATPSLTPCAVAVDVAPSTTRRRPALSAVTLLLSSALTTGARRPPAERPPVPVACVTCPMSTAASRTVSVRAPRPRSRSRPLLLKWTTTD